MRDGSDGPAPARPGSLPRTGADAILRRMTSPLCSPVRRRAAAVLLAGVVLAGCGDDALVSRVASLESSQDRLRQSISELQGGDADDGVDRVDAIAAELDGLVGRLDGVAEQVTAAEEGLASAEAAAAAAQEAVGAVEAQQLDADDRITEVELRQNELAAALEDLQVLRGQLADLTDRVSSLEAQFGAHRDNPDGHG